MICPFCHPGEPNYPDMSGNSTTIQCKNCGTFAITYDALLAAKHEAWKLSSYVSEQNRRGVNPLFFPTQRSVPNNSPVGCVGVDTVIQAFPASVTERLDQALISLAGVTKHLGQVLRIGSADVNPLLLSQNTAEVVFILREFLNEGYIAGWASILPGELSLTGKGLTRAADLRRGLYGPLHKQVFVAMSFDKSLDAAWTDGLKLAIEDCGYAALRVDAKEHNEKICDVIVAEIRKSKFLVADFSLHRNGVYFEAGMMMGLGRPVIFTCRKDELPKAHFDTRQYNHIEWETPAELRERLKRRIQATIAP